LRSFAVSCIAGLSHQALGRPLVDPLPLLPLSREVPDLTCDLLLISGSLRAGSVNAAVLKTAQQLSPRDATACIYESLSELPHFNPDDDREPLHLAVANLRNRIGKADALLFCTPEYAGALPGSFKNLLDWTVGGVEMDRKPVAWINTASLAAPAGGEDAHTCLRKVMGYVGATIVESACARIPISRQAVGSDGVIRDVVVRDQISATLAALVDHLKAPTSEIE
jgi:chromate reductase, NAD(P)H dehydrogenase (quinone)